MIPCSPAASLLVITLTAQKAILGQEFFSASSWKIGLSIMHGPHMGDQKSTTTPRLFVMMNCSSAAVPGSATTECAEVVEGAAEGKKLVDWERASRRAREDLIVGANAVSAECGYN